VFTDAGDLRNLMVRTDKFTARRRGPSGSEKGAMSNQELDAQVQWLVDRAAISDLLFAFAYALDTKNWTAYADTFAADGQLVLPWPAASGDGQAGHQGRAGLAEYVSNGFSRWYSTHHMSTNHRIEIDGDRATSHSYCQCVHRLDADQPDNYWLLAGWYRNQLVRTSDGWRFSRVQLEAVWQSGAFADPSLTH
jgi:hypothetical protein